MAVRQETVLIIGSLAAITAGFVPYFLSYLSLQFAVIILLLVVLVTVSLSTSLRVATVSSTVSVMNSKVNASRGHIFGILHVLADQEIITAKQVIEQWSDYDKVIADFEKGITNPLTPEKIEKRRELTAKVNANTITPEEASELRAILDEELREAQGRGNLIATIAIILLIGVVAAIIAAATSGQGSQNTGSS